MSPLRGKFENFLSAALALELPYSGRPPVTRGIPASVLVLFGAQEIAGEREPAVLLTVRTELVEKHKGQISFPGGVCDPEDSAHASLEPEIATALREAEEEVGISADFVRVLGKMPKLRTVTGFLITPVVSTLVIPVSEVSLRSNPAEIAGTFWAPLNELLAPGTYKFERYPWRGKRVPIHVYDVGTHRVWGATASILKNLLDRIELVRESSKR